MTDETKKLFDAPWTLYGEQDDYSFVLQDASEDEIATIFTMVEANRIVRLPELYDALMEAAKSYCQAADFDCPKKYCAWASSRKCKALKWLDLLKKVREGE